MANEKFTELPEVVSSMMSDIICAVQGGTSVQETMQQVFTLFLSNTILHNSGDPNGSVAGIIYQLCWDTSNSVMYVCTTSGNASTAVWSLSGSVSLPIQLSDGGTGKSLTASAGGIVWCDANSMEILAGVSTAGKILQSGNLSTPSWSTPTYPSISGISGGVLVSDGTNIVYSDAAFPVTVGTEGAIIISDGTNWVESSSLWTNSPAAGGKILRCDGTTNTYSTSSFADTYSASALLYSNGANNVTGLATANSSSLVTNSSGVPTWRSLANGQLLIGFTGGTPTPATLTAGGGISISNGPGTITISGTGSGIGWNEVTTTSASMNADAGYVTNNAGLVTLTLPTTASFGTYLAIIGKGAGGWTIAQNSGQNIEIGNVTTTVGVGGSLSSVNRYDSIELLCTTANTTWTALGAPQSSGLTYV